MADRRLVLSDLLCFIASKFGRVDVKMLKTVILDYYESEDILRAKWRLMDDVNELHVDQTPRISRRREGEKHVVRDLDDIFALLTFADENKIINKLPLYVTDDPDRMPSLRLFEGDLKYFYRKLEHFDSKIESYGSAMAAMMSELRSHLSDWPALCPPASHLASQQSTLKQSTAAASCTSKQPLDSHQRSWAVMTSSPNLRGNRYAALASTDDDDRNDGADDDDNPFTMATRRNKRRRERESTSPRLQVPHQTVSHQPSRNMQQSTETQQPRQQPQQPAQQQQQQRQQRAPAVLGRAATISDKVAAARKLRSKAVYCLDNINTNCSEADILSYVSKLSVEVYTCHAVKPRRRRGETEEQAAKDRMAFRLCIAADDRARLLDAAAWPDSIVISEWFFKPKDRNDGDDDEQAGTRSATATNQQQQQSAVQQQQQQGPAAAASAVSGGYDESTLLATSIMDYHDGS